MTNIILMKRASKRASRNPQQGSVMIVAMATLSGLLAVAALTLVNARRGIQASTQDTLHSSALYAAESGISAGMTFLRLNYDATTFYSAYVSANNGTVQSPLGIAGNAIQPGAIGNLFSPDAKLWFEVSILNNDSDVNFAAGTDGDGVVLLRSVGHAANGAQVTLEVEVSGAAVTMGGYRDLGQP